MKSFRKVLARSTAGNTFRDIFEPSSFSEVLVVLAGSKIGQRLALLVALCVFVAALAASLFTAFQQAGSQITWQTATIQVQTESRLAAIGQAISERNIADVTLELGNLIKATNGTAAAIVAAEGELIARAGTGKLRVDEPPFDTAGVGANLTRNEAPLSFPIPGSGDHRLVLMVDTTDVQMRFIYAAGIGVFIATLASFLAAMIARSPADRIVDPILRVTEAMRNVSQHKNYKTSIAVSPADETGEMIEAYNVMIADFRSRDMALQKLAYYDPLTGLPNRPHFQQSIEELLQKGTKAAIFLLDVDNFREINDALGHSIGDALLMEIAARLHEEASKDSTVFRVGSDEFVFVLPNVETEQRAEKELAKVFAKLYQPLKFLSHEVHISAAAGGVLMPRDGTNTGEVMRHIELALGEAKKLGPGRAAFFRPHLDERIQASAELVMGLKQALQRKDFQVYYQPQVDIAAGKVSGFEALVRWKHATKGFISPALFIPVAERAGLVPEIGKFVLYESCRQARAWFSQGLGMRQVSVNVSAAQMLQTDFLRQVQDALNETGLPPPLLCLELTESVFLGKSLGQIRHLLTDLKAMGVDIALDDFGTGYSSLSYLEGLPFDKLKIDRSFVNGAHSTPKRQLLLRHIIEMAHGLSMSIVAEGAETQEDVKMLASMDADTIQGFVYARPEPADAAMQAALKIEKAWQPIAAARNVA
jgi:diguanylate cyclase (GGDEF)-like protein